MHAVTLSLLLSLMVVNNQSHAHSVKKVSFQSMSVAFVPGEMSLPSFSLETISSCNEGGGGGEAVLRGKQRSLPPISSTKEALRVGWLKTGLEDGRGMGGPGRLVYCYCGVSLR